MITASKLFAPDEYRPGEHRCYYCGLDCDDSFTTKEHVKKTFTNRDVVKFPGSEHVCGCCVATLITITTTTLIDGDVKSGRGGAPRTYSWVLSPDGNKAFSKKHFGFAREVLSSPPAPPFSIVLADSGKKQIMFRAPVNHDRDNYTVQLEEQQIDIDDGFASILEAATLASAAIGKKSLSKPDEFNNYRQCVELFGDESILENWISIHNEPMAKLATWVCKGKKDARDEDFVCARIPAENSRSGRPEKKERSEKRGGNKTTGDQFLFDFA